jgi:hypothetical protein
MKFDFESLVEQAQEDAYKVAKSQALFQNGKMRRLIDSRDEALTYAVRPREDGRFVVINIKTYEVFAPYNCPDEARDVARDLNRSLQVSTK